jgi:hypothetical protein
MVQGADNGKHKACDASFVAQRSSVSIDRSLFTVTQSLEGRR